MFEPIKGLRIIHKDNGGYALVMAILIVAILTLLVTNLLGADLANIKSSKGIKGKYQAINTAESGYNLLIWNLLNDDDYFENNSKGVITMPNGQFSYEAKKTNGNSKNHYAITIVAQSENSQTTINVSIKNDQGQHKSFSIENWQEK